MGKAQSGGLSSPCNRSCFFITIMMIYWSENEATTILRLCAMTLTLPHLSFVQCEQVKSRPEKRVEIKVSDSAVATGTVGAGVGGGATPYLRRSKWKVEPIPLLSLSYAFLMRNRYPFIAGLTECSSRRMAKPGFELTTSRRLSASLPHNRVVLTTRSRDFSSEKKL